MKNAVLVLILILMVVVCARITIYSIGFALNDGRGLIEKWGSWWFVSIFLLILIGLLGTLLYTIFNFWKL